MNPEAPATAATAGDHEARDEAWPAPRHAWTALALLMLAQIVSTCDRTVINLLVEPIKREYGLSDTQFGALQGLAFGSFYISMAIPIGILSDRYQRRRVIGLGVGIFSLFSLMTGLARNYTHLFLARMGVGFGEASLGPAGYSMISDFFPKRNVGRATSMFAMSQFIGSSAAYVGGGLLVGWFTAQAASPSGPVLGLSPWQATIMCIALPGMILVPFLFLMREPARRGLAKNKLKLSFRELLHELGQRKLFLIMVTAGMAMASLMTQAVSMWTPALFIRTYGWSATETGVWLGAIVFVTSVTGSYLAGWAVDWLTARNTLDGPIKVAALSFLGAGAFAVAAPLMPSGELALALMAPMMLLKPMCFACVPIALQMVIPNQLRAQVYAGHMTVLNVVGLALGPVMIGLMTDQLFTDPSDVRYSMALMAAITAPIMFVLMLGALKPFRLLREQALAG